MYFKSVVAAFGLIVQIGQVVALNECQTSGMYLSQDNLHCYGLITLTREWNYHTVLCAVYQAKLVQIDSQEKQDSVAAFLGQMGFAVSNNQYVFIGLTNVLGDPANWVWYGGNITNYENWGTSEPVTTYRYHCAVMWMFDKKWYNQNCLQQRYGLCERDAVAADIDSPT